MKASSGANEGWLDEIEFAGRDAAGDEQEIGDRGAGERGVEGFGGVAGDGQNPRVAAGAETMAASMALLELRIWLGPGVVPMGTSSLPVERMATRGFTKTFSEVEPQDAARAICAAAIEEPAGRSISPLRACAARATMFSPLRIVRGGRRRMVRADASMWMSESSTCSSMMTAVSAGGDGSTGHDFPDCAARKWAGWSLPGAG